jgi:UDPglucose--hexose-1-phosphate uridylyltransferase
MSQLRQDRATGRWVIVAPERGARPQMAHSGPRSHGAVPSYDPSCPFCPGNEHLLPGIIDQIPAATPPGWWVRVIPNKYPALRPRDDPQPEVIVRWIVAAGFGHHEVIIETARHNADLVTLLGPHRHAVIRTYRDRFAALAARGGVESVFVFRNRGRRGGASLTHPHAQVIAMGMVPPRFAAMTARSREAFERTGRCPTCIELYDELADGHRVIEATERFIALVPFAAGSPFEIMIAPRLHQACFGKIDDGDCAALGEILRRLLWRLDALLDDVAYNYVSFGLQY